MKRKNNKEMDRLAIEWINEQSTRISQKMLEIVKQENKGELEDVDHRTRRLIHSEAIFTILKLVNFPKSFVEVDPNDDKFLDKYEKFSETLRHNISEICEALFNWKP